MAIGLKTNLVAAEQLKLRFGTADPSSVLPDEEISLDLMGEEGDRTALRLDVAEIIEARTREIFEKLGEQMAKGSHGHRLPAGLVLTGGGALLAGTATLGREVLGMPVRVATPSGIGGLTDGLLTPAVRDLDRPAAVGGPGGHRPRAAALRIGTRGRLAGQGTGVAAHAVPVTRARACVARADLVGAIGRPPWRRRGRPAWHLRRVVASADARA